MSLEGKKDKKVRLLFFITSLRYGGAERVLINLSRYLIKKDKLSISIMVLEDGVDYSVPEGIEVMKLHSGQHSALNKIFSLIFDPFRLKRFVLKNNVDIVLSFMQRPNVINMLSKVLGAPHRSIVNVRVYLKKHYESMPILSQFASKIMLKWLWRYADGTIANSRFIKDEIISLFNTDPKDVEVIYNPLDLKEIQDWSKEAVDDDWFDQKEIPIIINVGRLTKQKGHIYLLKAVSLIAAKRPVRLAIIGEGELKDELLKITGRLGIADKVRFMGLKKNPYKYMARSDVFVLSSLYEGFPNVVLEAMACRCPVVVSNCLSGPSEILLPHEDDKGNIVETNYGILINELSDVNLKEAIERILDRDAAKRYADAGFERSTQFNVDSIAKEYETVLLKGPRI